MRRLLAALLTIAVPLTLAACGAATKTTATGDSSTLRVAFQADMSVPDPDIFYDVEGNAVTLSAYEGLLKYAPDSTKIVGQLATSWTVSPDRRTYTFQLRKGVRFHDGTAMTSASVKASIQRRKAVAGGSSYMVADIDEIGTPAPATVVLHLDHPVGAFEDYLASTWSPKVIGPDALVTHAGSDHAQKWLSAHEDGTGPYELTGFERGRRYTLTSFAGYWGAKPSFKTVLINIVPDVSTQQLQLKGGDLDAILHSYPPSDLASAKADSALKVIEKPAFNRTIMYLNTHRPLLASATNRAAIAAAIDVKQITTSVYGDTATPATGPYPPGMLAGQPTIGAAASAPKTAGGKLELAYGPDAAGLLRSVAELVQAQLKKIGYDVVLKGVQLPDTFGYVKDPAHAPDLLLLTPVPDAAHPDTWAGPFWSTKGGLNLFGTSNPRIDAELAKAAIAPAAQAAALYRTMGAQIDASHSMLFISDVKDTFVVRADLTGFVHSPAYEWLLSPADLKRSA